MLKRLTSKILHVYSDSDYLIQRKAAVVLHLSIFCVFIAALYIIYTLVEHKPDPGMIIPNIAVIVLLLLNLIFLLQGRFILASHTFFFLLFTTIWVTMFSEKGPMLQRMDTFMLTIGLLTMTPLVITKKSMYIIVYYLTDFILLIIFLLTVGRGLGLTNASIWEYLIDSTSTLVFSGIVSYLVFSIHSSAIERLRHSEKSIEEKNRELSRLNSQLNESLSQIAAANEEYIIQNQMLQSAQEELSHREATLSGLLRAMPVGLAIVRARIFTWVNDKLCNITGYTRDELVGMDARKLYRTDAEYEYLSGFAEIHGSGNPAIQTETIWLCRDGKTITVSLMGSSINSSDPEEGYIVTVIDITEKLDTLDALKKSKILYRLLAENISDIIWAIDLKLQPTYISPTVTAMYGYSPEEAMANRMMAWIPENMKGHFRKIYGHLLDFASRPGETPPSVREILPQKKKDGTPFWVEIEISVMRDLEQNPVGFVGVTRDITSRKNMEDALQLEKERLTVTLKSISDGVIATDMNGHIILMNRAAEELTGIPFAEADGRKIETIYRPCDSESGEENSCAMWVLKTGETMTPGRNLNLLSPNGKGKRITETCSPLRASDNTIVGIVTVFRDVTEKETWERERLKIQQLESLGVLAGGIAHDFNNILSGILGNISLARMAGITEEERLENIHQAEKASEQARRLTSQLLTFARGGSPVRENSPLKEILTESVSFALSGSGVRCNYEMDDQPWPGSIDRGQISQVIQNLALNAMQAMDGKGTLDITLRNYTLTENDNIPLPPGRYLKLTFGDSGKGINPEHIDRIFEPYFTTRREGHGLGLSVVYSIVLRHGGHISVSSRPGRGALFTIYLPAADESSADHLVVKSDLPLFRQSRVIVMDDEEAVRTVAAKMLRSLGCEVLVASNGEEVIDIYHREVKEGRSVDLVILDITVPGAMGGRETIEHLHMIYPDARAVISSGYSNDLLMSDYRSYGFAAVLTKPYSREELSAAIETALGNA